MEAEMETGGTGKDMSFLTRSCRISLRGGSWDLVTTYNWPWASNPTKTPPPNGLIGVTPGISRKT